MAPLWRVEKMMSSSKLPLTMSCVRDRYLSDSSDVPCTAVPTHNPTSLSVSQQLTTRSCSLGPSRASLASSLSSSSAPPASCASTSSEATCVWRGCASMAAAVGAAAFVLRCVAARESRCTECGVGRDASASVSWRYIEPNKPVDTAAPPTTRGRSPLLSPPTRSGGQPAMARMAIAAMVRMRPSISDKTACHSAISLSSCCCWRCVPMSEGISCCTSGSTCRSVSSSPCAKLDANVASKLLSAASIRRSTPAISLRRKKIVAGTASAAPAAAAPAAAAASSSPVTSLVGKGDRNQPNSLTYLW
mmetsp:Transcript_100335/g.146490  ORF Transcript_100335/g.146490 Transcript_100335/m.146490 type:complete len:304 (+) Transcript_100335:2155-3066(+)